MSYRQLATRPVVTWAVVAICARLPVAMTPFALVFLVRERPGGYALGAGLAAAYALGEVAGAAYSIAAALGAALYGARASWPGSVRTQSLVLLLGLTGCATLVATVPSLAWIAAALIVGGMLESGVQLTRSLSMRAILPPSAHAAGYSVMYAATGVGYAASAILAAVVLRATTPSVAILAGVGLTLLLTAASAAGELSPLWRSRAHGEPAVDSGHRAGLAG